MYKKVRMTISEWEQLAFQINSLGDHEGTSRKFNFALNKNFDVIKDLLMSSEKSVHPKPKRIIQFEEEMKELAMEFSAFPKTRYRNTDVTYSHIHNEEGFKAEALKLKEKYSELLDSWALKEKENAEFREETLFEMSLFVLPSEEAPDMTPKQEYWIGKILDYSDIFDEEELEPETEEKI